MIIGCIAILITVYIHIFMYEAPADAIELKEEKENKGCCHLLFLFRGFVLNPHLRYVLFMLLFDRLGFAAINATYHLRLVRNGFKKE